MMDFADALKALKIGGRVCREGWNGKGMWLVVIPENEWAGDPSRVRHFRRLPWIGMKTADDGFVPWLASQTDILASDWQEVAA